MPHQQRSTLHKFDRQDGHCLIWIESWKLRSCGLSSGTPFRAYQGTNFPLSSILTSALEHVDEDARCFEDFDVYTMQRSPVVWSKFCSWKRSVKKNAKDTPLKLGDTLNIIPGAASLFALEEPHYSSTTGDSRDHRFTRPSTSR